MSDCKECGKRFHYGSWCTYKTYLSNGFCSTECMEKSKLYQNGLVIAKKLIKSLDDLQKQSLFFILKFCDDFNLDLEALKEKIGEKND